MHRVFSLASLLLVIGGCATVAYSDGEPRPGDVPSTAGETAEYADPLDSWPATYRSGLVVTDNDDGTWDGEERATWEDENGDVRCEVLWTTSGTVDDDVACDGCVLTLDVLCSDAEVLSGPGSCDDYYTAADLAQDADFWVGWAPGADGVTGTYLTGDTEDAIYDPNGTVYWGDFGTATFDGTTLNHDNLWDISSGYPELIE